MKTILKRDFRSVLFVIVVTLFGLTLAYLIIFELSDKQKLAAALMLVAAFLVALSLGISIVRENKEQCSR